MFFPWVKTGKLEELERLRGRPSTDLAPAATTSPPLVSAEKVEGIAATVQELASGAGGLSRRQAALENRCFMCSAYICVCKVCSKGRLPGRAHAGTHSWLVVVVVCKPFSSALCRS